MPFDILGKPASDTNRSGSEDYLPITSDYFKTLDIPLVAGRFFRVSDESDTEPVIIVNEEFARTYFKGQSPLGQHIRIGAVMGPGFEDQVREIIGIVGDTKNSGLDKPSPGIMYLPQSQIPDAETQMQVKLLGVSWVIRMKADHIDVMNSARRIFWDDARAPLYDVQPMSAVIGDSIAQQRFTMILLGCFGFISLCLGATGLYGVMSYTVAGRTKEIGVRMAVGADRQSILWMVLREAGVLVGFGLAIGFVASLMTVQLLRTFLFHVSPRDPFVWIVGCGVLLITGFVSAWQPASSAASSEPMQALRSE
jgi:predicted permease